ncbi:hypothetical protein DXD68_23365 [Parabacteroides sp. TM07-1AC]|nr:hypothetical protein DXD68_23365 [Parabacteroides sp. TM07-1AC]
MKVNLPTIKNQNQHLFIKNICFTKRKGTGYTYIIYALQKQNVYLTYINIIRKEVKSPIFNG